MPTDGFDIDVQGAAAAIDEAGGLDTAFQEEVGYVEPQVAAPAPTGTTDQTGATPPASPTRDEFGRFTSPPQEEQPADTSFMGENFDPNALPPELQPAYKQMQAHWTRTLQQAAPYRRIADEFQLEDPSQLREIVQFHQDLQDPNAWLSIYNELGTVLQQQGLTPAQAQQQAAEMMGSAPAQPTQAAQQGDPLAALADDPELQPIRSVIDDLRNQVTGLKTDLEQRAETERQQMVQMAVQGEHQRQENIIRQSRPDWGDQDVEAIYALSVPLNGNLLDAAAQYESMQARWADQFVGQKESPAPPQASQPVNAQQYIEQIQSQGQGQEAPRVATLDEAHAALMEHLRSIGAAD